MDMSSGDSSDERIVPLRLQRFLARSGVASRRGSENLMTAGRVQVNGKTVTELGSKVNPLTDVVCVDGVAVRFKQEAVVLALHKPAGVLTTMSDPHGRPTVAGLVPAQRYPGLFPIGRLDADTTGLLLFSTDGNLGNRLLHPRYHVAKTYYAFVEGKPSAAVISRLSTGVMLEDGPTLPAQVRLARPGRELAFARERLAVDAAAAKRGSLVLITLREGRKRQVKRMFEAVGHPVRALHRESFGGISLGLLQQGAWRELSDEEIASLRNR